MHKRIVVVNSTPLIALCSIDKLGLLRQLYGEILIPRAVYAEISAKKDSKVPIEVANSKDWIKVVDIKNTEAKRFFKVQLHDGEVEVMILGKEVEADLLIIDDYIAREHAKYLDFKITGTLGVLVKSKERGFINSTKDIMDTLINNGIYIGACLYQDVLKKSGE